MSPLQGEDIFWHDPGLARETRLPLATIFHAFSVMMLDAFSVMMLLAIGLMIISAVLCCGEW